LQGLVTISYDAFAECTNLKNIVLPDSVRTVHNFAFLDCTNLEYIVVGTGIYRFSHNGFIGCDKLEAIYYHGDAESWAAVYAKDFPNEVKDYVYSETKPSVSGRFWRYVNGRIVVWK